MSGSAQQIEVVYSFKGWERPDQTKTVTAAASPRAPRPTSSRLMPGNGIPGSLGSAKITGKGGGNIAVIVNDAALQREPAAPDGLHLLPGQRQSNKVALPLYKEYFNGNTAQVSRFVEMPAGRPPPLP